MPRVDHDVRYGTEPAVLVISECAPARREAGALAQRLGARAVMPPTFDEGMAALDGLSGLSPVLLAIDADGGDALDRLLERLDADAAMLGRPSVVSLPVALVDVVAARAPHPAVALLPDAAAEEKVAALATAIAAAQQPQLLLREESAAPVQLLQLSEEVGRIARTLAALSGANERRPNGRVEGAASEARPPSAATVRAVIRSRRLREQFFEPTLFADPAWDMMLDLYAAQLEGRPVAVSSLCIAAAVPPTTALRWMKQLVDDALFIRIADPRDGRRVFIELSPAAADGLAGYFEALSRVGFALP